MRNFLLVLSLVVGPVMFAMEHGQSSVGDKPEDGPVYTVADIVKNQEDFALPNVKARRHSFRFVGEGRKGSGYQTNPDEKGKVIKLFYNKKGDLVAFDKGWAIEDATAESIDDQIPDERKKKRVLRSVAKYIRKNKIKTCLLGGVLGVIAYFFYRRVATNQNRNFIATERVG